MRESIEKLSAQIEFSRKQSGEPKSKFCLNVVEKNFAIIEKCYEQILDKLVATTDEAQKWFEQQMKKLKEEEPMKVEQ